MEHQVLEADEQPESEQYSGCPAAHREERRLGQDDRRYMSLVRAHGAQQPHLPAPLIHNHGEGKCHDQKDDEPKDSADDQDRLDQPGELIPHRADDCVGNQGLDSRNVMLDPDRDPVRAHAVVHLYQHGGYPVPSDLQGLEGLYFRILRHGIGCIHAHEHGSVDKVQTRGLKGTGDYEMRAEKGNRITDDDRNFSANDDLADRELSADLLFEPGFYGEVRLGVEGNEKYVFRQATEEARRLDEYLRSNVLHPVRASYPVKNRSLHEELRRLA